MTQLNEQEDENDEGIGYRMDSIIFQADTETDFDHWDELEITDLESEIDLKHPYESKHKRSGKIGINPRSNKSNCFHPLLIALLFIIGILIGFALGFMFDKY